MKLIDEQREEHSVVKLCELLKIDPSRYYRHCRQGSCNAQQSDEWIVQAIRESYQQSREIYGRPRIQEDLRKKGIRIGSTRLARLMKQEGIVGAYNEPRKPKVTDSRHGGRISPNRLKERDFPTTPREVVVTDTTYVWSDQGWRYLATVMDLFTREILGWSFSKTNDSKLVCQALWNASEEVKDYEKVIHHSDRGSTYCSDDYPAITQTVENDPEHERKGILLRQCPYGIVLWFSEM